LFDTLRTEIQSLEPELIRLRRDFHRHPELGLEETRSAGIIAKRLEALGMEVAEGVGHTGVVGLLEGRGPGRTLLLRADMDALPIQEENETPYRSEVEGVMHACGHDGHMAILLGVAEVLSRRRDRFPGRVKFIFQPGEEAFDGARLMIEDGALANPRPDAALGLHLASSLPVGRVGVRSGPAMASSDAFTIRLLGEAGHGAHPEGGVDAILISGHVITSLQSLVSREVPAQQPLVVHIGLIRGGTAGNIIADRVTLRVSVRTLDKEVRSTIPARLDRILGGITAAFRGRHELTYLGGVGPVVNDAAMTALVQGCAAQCVGAENVVSGEPTMGSDDVARFLEAVPGCFFFVGSGNQEQGFSRPHHHPRFDIDERALAIGAEILACSALTYLTSG
jgi:amidohydrolase